jgi:hypothetical protein
VRLRPAVEQGRRVSKRSPSAFVGTIGSYRVGRNDKRAEGRVPPDCSDASPQLLASRYHRGNPVSKKRVALLVLAVVMAILSVAPVLAGTSSTPDGLSWSSQVG